MISIDTHIMLWGVKEEASPGQEDKIPLAKAFLKHCRNDRITVVITTQVLAEFLVNYTEEERLEQAALAEKNFFVAPLDLRAAVIAAELSANKALLAEVRQSPEHSKQTVKADINVLAASISCGATRVISEDDSMAKLAQGKILVSDLLTFMASTVSIPGPSTPTSKPGQTDLFS